MQAVSYKLIEQADDLSSAFEHLREELIIGLDTETTGLDPHTSKLRLIQLATPAQVYLIDCFRLNAEQLTPILGLLAAPRPLKIAHNAKFDAKFLLRHCGIRLAGIFDTYLASVLASAGDENNRHGLDAVATRYLDTRVVKDMQMSDWRAELSRNQLEYAAYDAAILLSLYEKLQAKLAESDLLLAAEIEFDCILVIAAMELAGFYLDVGRWRELIGKFRAAHEIVSEELQHELSAGAAQMTLFGEVAERINLDSPSQVKDALARIGIEVDDTREWTLQKLAREHPVLEKLIEHRSLSKNLSAYGEGVLDYINPLTGRIHADFRQIGTPTGRITTSSPSLQQIPHTTEYRSCFRAPAGRQFIVADYCVAEGTRIATERGLMPVESVTAGERVFLEDGTSAEVTAVIDRGVLPVVTLTLKNGYSLTATAFHRVRALDAKGDYVWRRIGEIGPTDFVVIQPGRGLHNGLPKEVFQSLHTSHSNQKDVRTPEKVDAHLAALLGYLTGDGSLEARKVRWVVNIQDQDTADLLEQWARELFGLPVHHRGPYRGVLEYGIYSTLLVSWLKEIGVSKNEIPSFVWRSGPKIVASYLSGIFESDGSVTDSDTGKVSFGSSRERLAREVHQLLLALGIPATLRHQRNIGPDRRFSCWIVSVLASGVKRFYEQVGFISSRKQGKLAALVNRWTGKTVAGNMPNLKQKVSGLGLSGELRRLLANTWCLGRPVSRALAINIEKNYPEIARQIGLEHITEYNQLFLPVVSIEPAGNQHVYDLTVPGPTTYISNGFVSHNSQIEMRILADFARDEALLKAFDSGADLHRMTASQMFGVPLDQVTPRQRESAKGLNYGLVYGMGAEGLAARIESSVKEAEIMIERYFTAYSGVERWLTEAAERAVRERRARTASGRLWVFRLDPRDRSQLGALKRVGKNAPIQGSASDIFKRAMTLLDRALLSRDAQIVNSIHDEIVVECDGSIAEEVKQIVIRKMIEGAKEFLPRVPVEVEAVISNAWLKK